MTLVHENLNEVDLTHFVVLRHTLLDDHWCGHSLNMYDGLCLASKCTMRAGTYPEK